ncbi:MAG TPA: FG-GAP-like repeat-containing protein [Nocardioides sp.]|uniref:FG-GAP-like repeat-containing protein n=1 Tax=Nocardioides sp. TaxID=35761 RepID=UPI002E31AB5A|nr:FG-GAP-like repeat-containing protein [Nocardioides sp.]HEX3929302.1 FG-GAP-like repeat-containing protein [Nocardioides sp.]
MTPNRSRFVTACQQLLALGVVLAALTPAASVVTLDVVGSAPDGPTATSGSLRSTAAFAAYTAQAVQKSKVPTSPVASHVREVPLTAAATVAGRPVPTRSALVRTDRSGASQLTTTPERVTGFGEVGVTWAHGTAIPETALSVLARTRTGDQGWTRWTKVPYDPDHGPDPGSAEARRARPGTDPVLVGRVDDVQVRVVARRTLPADLRLAVIAPGHARHTTEERAAIDTSTMDGDQGADSVADVSAAEAQAGSGAALAAAVFTPRPVIYSRAQWGADERIREKSSLHYGDVHAGFVHHTVNANDYTRAEVPGILRSIYAYHVESRGWSDIGYNFLIDRFGRIWEGRYGGVDRPVVGAHTQGYNDDAFAASAIGNYQIAKPSKAMIQAYGALFAWKLSLHGVDAASTHQWVTSRWFEAINGHRDAAATLCPGQYLYAKLPKIRRLAAAAQRGWSGRQLDSNLASTPAPDIVVRRASDGEAFVVPTGGLVHFPAATTVGSGAAGATQLVVAGDLTGDGRADLLVRRADGTVELRPGQRGGTFGAASATLPALTGLDQLVAPGDLNGDGRADLAARNPTTGALVVFLQRAGGGLHRQRSGGGWGSYDSIAAAGDLDGDGHPDLVVRDADGHLWLRPGRADATFGPAVQVPGSYRRYDVLAGAGDLSHDGHADLLVRERSTGDSYVLPGRGDGSFARRLGPVTRFAGASLMAVGNVAGSKAADVVALDGGKVKAWVNPGGFDLGRPVDTRADFGRADRILVVGDWDRDGSGDVVTRQGKHGNLVLWRGNGHGRLTRAAVLGSGFDTVGRLTAVGDLTGDGYPDLVGQPRGGVLMVYPGKGLAGLRKPYPVYGAIAKGTPIGVGRWDADGAPDVLLRRGASLRLLHGNGPGGLHGPTRLAADLAPYDWTIGIGDLQLTGHPDLIAREKGTGRLYAIPGRASGLRSPVFVGGGFGGYDLAG